MRPQYHIGAAVLSEKGLSGVILVTVSRRMSGGGDRLGLE
jgi:hypothetical protein